MVLQSTASLTRITSPVTNIALTSLQTKPQSILTESQQNDADAQLKSYFGITEGVLMTGRNSLFQRHEDFYRKRIITPSPTDAEKILPEDFYPDFTAINYMEIVPRIEKAIAKAQTLADELIARLETLENPTFEDVAVPLNHLEHIITYAFSPISHLKGTMVHAPYVNEINNAKERLIDFNLKLAQNQTLYSAFKKIRDGVEWYKLEEWQRRVVDKQLLAFKLSGIGMSKDDAKKYAKISKELSKLSTQFSKNISDASKSIEMIITNKDELTGLTESDFKTLSKQYREKYNKPSSPEEGPWLILDNTASDSAIFQNCTNRNTREKVYHLSYKINVEGEYNNTPLIKRILQLRLEKAKLLGFNNFAELSLAKKMARTPENVWAFLNKLKESAIGTAKIEKQELQDFAEKLGFEGELKPWDTGFYSNKMQERDLSLDPEKIKNYFTYERALEGLFETAGNLFNITILEATHEVSIYHEDVKFFKVFNSEGTHIASFYADPYERIGTKRGGAWMDQLRSRRINSDGNRQIPVSVITMNYERPLDEKGNRLTIRNLVTLFHEFGHALQNMLTQMDNSEVSGINSVEWDAVEIASQFLQRFVYTENILKRVSSHRETDQQISDEEIQNILKTQTYRSASGIIGQLIYGMADLAIHENYDPYQDEVSPHDVFNKIIEDIYGNDPNRQPNYMFSRFSHLFSGGYAAGYFSYMWADGYSADFFEVFRPYLNSPEDLGILGNRIENTHYAQGGGRHPAKVAEDFLGRPMDPTALLRDKGVL